jgi:hypothetical protein
VLPAFQNRARGILHDKPARTGNPLANLKLGAELVGITVPVVTHDLRRGAAADISNVVDGRLKGALDDSVVANLGHSQKAVNMGVTRAYIGSLKTDAWELRTDALNEPEEDHFGVEMAPVPFKRRKYTKDSVITEYCESHDLDPTRSADRQRASIAIREEEKKAFFDSQVYVDDGGQQELDQDAVQKAGPGKLSSGRLPLIKTM